MCFSTDPVWFSSLSCNSLMRKIIFLHLISIRLMLEIHIHKNESTGVTKRNSDQDRYC